MMYVFLGGDPCDPNSDPLELAAYSGTFTSANYPGNYPDDAICEWRIVSAESNGVRTVSMSRLCVVINVYRSYKSCNVV